MRVALLASTLFLMAGTPAFAQCVYVACTGGAQQAPAYQPPPPPSYQVPMQAPQTRTGYDEGYAAGVAARPATRHTGSRPMPARPVARTSVRKTGHHVARMGTGTTSRTAARSTGSRGAATVVQGRSHVATKARATVVRQSAVTRQSASTTTHATRRPVYNSQSHVPTQYIDPIKDRAATYRPQVTGQSTSLASMMSSSSWSSSSSTTTWSGPASVVNQGGQVCGWGARIVTNAHGYAQRQAVWVCQCPQGWRPPGY
jgi:hypothetical protein